MGERIATVAMAIVSLATVAVIVGGRNTSGVIRSFGSAFSGAIASATAPAGGGGGGGGGGGRRRRGRR